MTDATTHVEAPDDAPEIAMERRLNAPPDLVFEAWTNPDLLKRWWGPDGFAMTVLHADIRQGGVLRFTLHGPDGTDYPNRMTYREVVAPQRLAYRHDADTDEDPRAMDVTVAFEPKGGGTVVRMRTVFPSMEARAAVVAFGAMELGRQTFEKMAAFVETGAAQSLDPSR